MIKVSAFPQIDSLTLSIIAVVVSVIALLVSVYKEIILPLWIKPNIKIIYENDEECIHDAMGWDEGQERYVVDSKWLRLKIVNAGRTTAKGCYVKLTAIRNDKGELIKPFDPCPLIWTIFNKDNWKNDYWKIDLAKKEHHFIDLAYQHKGNDFVIMRALSLPTALVDKIKKSPPGKFKFDVTTYGDNVEPVSEQVSISITKNYAELKFDK